MSSSQIINLIKARAKTGFKFQSCSNSITFNNHNNCNKRINQYREFHSTKQVKLDDPYKTLGIDKSASSSQIKKAYYKLAKKFHPDINQEKGADEKFHSLQEAYDILSDPKKKEQYDQFGPAAFNQGANSGSGHPYGGGNPFSGGFGGFSGFGGFGGQSQGNPFEGINFEDLFGGGSGFNQGNNNRRGGGIQHFQGEDIEILKTIPFKESIFGTKIKVNYSAIVQCNSCHGNGLKEGKKKSTCKICNGTGTQMHHLQGGFHMPTTCKGCNGTGVQIKHEDECNKCHGEGVNTEIKQTEVRLPSGIKDGSRIRVSGAGDAPHITTSNGYKLINGDLIIRIRVQPDPNFLRDGKDLIFKTEIPMTTAALGGVIEIPTLEGNKIKLRIPSGSQNDRIIDIPDKGVPLSDKSSNRGSLKVILKIKTLRPNNATQIALLEAVADAFGDSTAKRLDPNWKPLEGVTKDSNNNNSNTNSSNNKVEDNDNVCEHPNNLKRINSFLNNAFKKIIGEKGDKEGDGEKK
ncbi:hypothetical protein C6P40_002117 [Pichia californica]|uniref:Uncharacterized protein n=1 Tax=Pichia californica TaxID=460514 RepID=A0A9P7BIA1_9ASCO|nr:hypothetical protein C6P42_001371 [[Candida] californica]KAG0690618.1 hypothetical protein C6P40_002117 [[Candida] californica]